MYTNRHELIHIHLREKGILSSLEDMNCASAETVANAHVTGAIRIFLHFILNMCRPILDKLSIFIFAVFIIPVILFLKYFWIKIQLYHLFFSSQNFLQILALTPSHRGGPFFFDYYCYIYVCINIQIYEFKCSIHFCCSCVFDFRVFFNSVINIKENTACDLSMHEMYLII